MSTTVLTSEALAWGDILPAVLAGNEVVVEDDHQPTAVVVSYAQWKKIQYELRLKELDQISATMEAGQFATVEEVDQGFAKMGYV